MVSYFFLGCICILKIFCHCLHKLTTIYLWLSIKQPKIKCMSIILPSHIKSYLHKNSTHPDPVYIIFVFSISSLIIIFPPLFKRGLPRIPAGADCFSASSLGSSHIYGHHLYSVWRVGILIKEDRGDEMAVMIRSRSLNHKSINNPIWLHGCRLSKQPEGSWYWIRQYNCSVYRWQSLHSTRLPCPHATPHDRLVTKYHCLNKTMWFFA